MFKIGFVALLITINSYRICENITRGTTQIGKNITKGTTQSHDEDNITCPYDFEKFDSKCYILNETCTYHSPLPFNEYRDIVENISETCILDINKKSNYDYYWWTEHLGNYGKLFTENFIDADDSDYGSDYVIANFNTSNVTYFTIKNTSDFNYMCAYDSVPDKTTFCYLYDQICANNTERPTTNCHCQNETFQGYFCQLTCTDPANTTVCDACGEIYKAYKEPSISLGFDYHQQLIYVTVLSYRKLVPVDKTGDVSIYCYTNAERSTHDITYRYNVTEITSPNGNYKDKYYIITPRPNAIGHYWCEGFKFGDTNATRSNTIIANKNSGESFTMNVIVDDGNRTYPLTLHEDTLEDIESTIENNSLPILQVLFLNLYEKNNTINTTKIGYRLYFNNTIISMTDILNITGEEFSNSSVGPSYCLPDTTTQIDNTTLTWGKTLLGMTVLPEELCLQTNSQPVTRTCLGEYLYGVYWSDVQGWCVNNSGKLFGSKSTISLHNLTHTNNPADKIMGLQTILTEQTNHIAVDTHFMAQIFENVTLSNTFIDPETLIQIANDIMDLDRTVLTEAQKLLNSTDMILYNLDKLLSTHDFRNTSGNFIIVKKNIFVQVSAFKSSDAQGTAVYETGDGVTMIPLPYGYMLEDLTTENLKLAVFVNGSELKNSKPTTSESRLVITVFRHDSLFNNGSFPDITGYLVGVTVTIFEQPFLFDSVQVIITPDRKYRAELFCNHWDYGRDKLWYNQRGKWQKDFRATPFKDSYSCDKKAMTKIALLTGTEADVALSVIAAVGCALSMFGSMAVIITGLIYRNWRENSGTKILLNFVLTNFTQNIILAASSGVDSYKQTILCIITGACLHYSVISQFTWMVIIGYLQYERYVQVFYTVSTRFLLLASILAWIIPTIPVITVLAIDDFQHSAYVQEKFCYLHEKTLMYGVYLPVALTLSSNTCIFGIIIINIYCRKRNTLSVRDNMSWLNLRLVILLFFLLGLYWVFGIAARLTELVAFDYFFCISAAMQGLVIFLYFIVFNKMTRNFWMKQLRRSEMITAMQIWLQRRKKIGRVRIDKGRVKHVKVGIVKTLQGKNEGVKLA